MTKLNIKFKRTERGFIVGEFKEHYGKECSIQESSGFTEAIWLGQKEGDHINGQCLARMLLTRKQVAELIPILQGYVDTGALPEPKRANTKSSGTRR